MKSKPNLANINVDDAANRVAIDDVIQGYKQALTDFEVQEGEKLPDELEQFLMYVAKTGDTLSMWDKVQRVFIQKMKLVLDEFYENNPYKAGKINPNCENDPFSETKERLVQLANKFDCAPFTMQRLCELITNPQKNYTKCEKFMRALEKNLMVVTSWSYPSRRNSEVAEQLNGGFETLPSLSSRERSWSALPHSPITTSAPSIPVPLQHTEMGATDMNGGESVSSIESEAVLLSKSDNVENIKQDSSIITSSVDDDDQKPTNEDKDNVASPKEDEPLIKEADQSVEAESNVIPLPVPNTLTNSEKDALKEPLPGVGTLVEKHSAKANSSGILSSTTSNASPGLSEPSKVEEKIETFRVTASPKRKSDDDPLADTGAVKRRKSEDGSAEMASSNQENS